MTVHRTNHVCFKCRVVFKCSGSCPYCQKHLVDCGYRWRFPKKTDIKGWKKTIETMRNFNPWYKNIVDTHCPKELKDANG